MTIWGCILKKLFAFLALLLSVSSLSGSAIPQEDNGLQKKNIVAVRTQTSPKIDGIINEGEWKNAVAASDFVMYAPYSGIPSKYSTEVRVLYDDNALYISAIMYDTHPDSIFLELGSRDAQNLNADHFYIELSPFNDGLNGELFKVSASNVQIDNKLQTSQSFYHDDTWDAVWESKTSITDSGWSAEIRIPYSALRFPKSENQTWGINFWREVRRSRETSSWNYVSKEIGSTIAHLGVMTGIRNIKPPLRLSLTPYLSGYLEKVSEVEGVGTSYNGGLDIKLGLSESFTLDATLIPDFGQVQSDDHVLNLTPYEIQYNEKRPFFMEGTELFNKGEIFYSRRVGGTPHLVDNVYGLLESNEIITRNPTEVSLINATKLSGRLKNGLGVGVFNAITGPVWADVKNTVTNETRRIRTEPLTNYNMLVVDQSLRNNSFVSFSNTNVLRSGTKDENFYTANVSNVSTLLQTNNKLYSIEGSATISQKYFTGAKADLGHSLNLTMGKSGGAFRAEYYFSVMSDRFDPNDMGYLRNNNQIDNMVFVSYNTFEPVGKLMNTSTEVFFGYQQLFSPRAFTAMGFGLESMIVLMNYWSFSLEAEYMPKGENDFFEPRTEDMSMFYHKPKALDLDFRMDTDMSKKFYILIQTSCSKLWSEFNQRSFSWSLQPQYKISRRFSLNYSFDFFRDFNDIGFVDKGTGDEIYFGKRNLATLVNTLSGSYIFNAASYLSLRGRHYWSRAFYDGEYFILQEDGGLLSSAYSGTTNRNSNFFNIDMIYTWRFTPGSEMSLVWKNSVYSDGDYIINNVFVNFHDLFSMPQTNSISLKILYYLDYQNVKKMFQSK